MDVAPPSPPAQADKAKHGKVVGIIHPPPDIRAICDKTAGFVAKNGRVFEAKIKAQHSNSVKFKFLQEDDPYHAYYLFKIEESKKADAAAAAPPASSASAAASAASSSSSASADAAAGGEGASSSSASSSASASSSSTSSSTTVAKGAQLSSVAARVGKVPRGKRPPAEEFAIYHPEFLSALDLDVLKLTAQMTASSGRQFLQGLAQRESRNPQFDFLRPTHALFGCVGAMGERERGGRKRKRTR